MPTFEYQTLPKDEIARSQLEVALEFYLLDREYPAVITLAGAAEEILGKLASSNGHRPALAEIVERLTETYKEVWGEETNPKNFIEIRNRARNEMKHFTGGADVVVDLELEAGELLERALDNYKLCFNQHHPLHYRFVSKRVDNWRKKSMTG
jgi:hypothetical protein